MDYRHEHFTHDPEAPMKRDNLITIWKSELRDAKTMSFMLGLIIGAILTSGIFWTSIEFTRY